MSRSLLAGASIALLCHAAPLSAQQADTGADSARVSAALDAVYDRFSRAYRLAEADSVLALYTEDAHYLQPGGAIRVGHDAIRPGFAGFLDRFRAEGRPGPNIDFEIVRRDIADGLATDIGYYRFDGTRAGKFVVVWRRGDDGRWRILADAYNRVD